MQSGWTSKVPRTLTEWKENHVNNTAYWSPSFQYYGYKTKDNKMCLALLRNTRLKRRQIMSYLGLPNSAEGRKQVAMYNCKHMLIIQIGEINVSFPNKRYIPSKYEDQTNLVMIESDQLLPFPVPINIYPHSYCQFSYNIDGNVVGDSRWIITDAVYEKAYNLCIRAIEYAKKGDWDSFELEIIQNKSIVESSVFVCVFVCNIILCLGLQSEIHVLCQSVLFCFIFVLKGLTKSESGRFTNFSFFKHWSVLHEAVAWNQKSFVIEYMSNDNTSCFGDGKKMILLCGMYGRFWTDLFVSRFFSYQYGPVLHKAIEYKQYNFLESFMKDDMHMLPNTKRDQAWRYKKRSSNYGADQNVYTSVIGTAIECNDLKALKLITEWNNTNNSNKNKKNKKTKKYRHNELCVDNFAWCGNTAIQFAFIVCDDNFQMLKYLLKKHKPKFKNYDIQAVDEKDEYLLFKTIVKKRDWGDFEEYEVTVRDRIKGEITFKPDCEGYTIDERIEMCLQNGKLTQEQCNTLLDILKTRRTVL